MAPELVLVTTDLETNAQIKKLGVAFLELRVDLLRKQDIAYACALFRQRRKLRIPLILTVRNQRQEGARRVFSDGKKWELMQALMPLTDWVDIELSSPLCARVAGLARAHQKEIIISKHDFARVPRDLTAILKKALGLRPGIVKIAVQANSPGDLARMVAFTQANRKRRLVTMCVGAYGPLSRLVLPAVGSRWIYTFLGKAAVPGQIGVHALKEHLHLMGVCA